MGTVEASLDRVASMLSNPSTSEKKYTSSELFFALEDVLSLSMHIYIKTCLIDVHGDIRALRRLSVY